MNHPVSVSRPNERASVTATRRPINLSIDPVVLADAKALGINISRVCESALAAQVQQLRREQWLAENREAMDDYNAYVEANGLPLAHLRQF